MSKDVAVQQAILISDPQVGRPDKTFGDRWRNVLETARSNPLGAFGLVLIVVFGLMAVFAPWIAPYDPDTVSANTNAGMSGEHWFGTERLGRDIFSRVVWGARISLSVAFISVIGGGTIGIIIGIISGYTGGAVDSVIQRTVDTAIAFPALLLLLIITQSFEPSFRTIVFALMIAVIPGVTRVVRGAVLSEKNNQYIEAARASGAWGPRVLFRHVLPNVVALGIIVMTTLLGGIILAEAALSFLGLGIPGVPSWGQDVNSARNFPYHIPAAFFPGAAITLTVLGFNLLGDSIRDIADPRLRGSR